MPASAAGETSLVTFLFLVVLAVIGVGITDYSPADAHRYWLIMILLCAGIAMYGALRHERGESAATRLRRLRVQLLHWSACIAAVIISYALVHNGRLNNADAGLVILLLLSLTVFLDGANAGRHFYLLGLLLGLITLIMAYVEEFIWIILITSVAITLAAVAWERHRARRD